MIDFEHLFCGKKSLASLFSFGQVKFGASRPDGQAEVKS